MWASQQARKDEPSPPPRGGPDRAEWSIHFIDEHGQMDKKQLYTEAGLIDFARSHNPAIVDLGLDHLVARDGLDGRPRTNPAGRQRLLEGVTDGALTPVCACAASLCGAMPNCC